MENRNKQKKVFVGLSGGVDSSVAALLLKRQGYDVVGVYMKNWSEESFGGKLSGSCPWKRDLKDVRAVCRILDIPLKVYNFEKAYKRKVIDAFFKGERLGLTPNPDVVCNREIKFGTFLKRAVSEGADFVATGHYARLRTLSQHPKPHREPLSHLGEGGRRPGEVRGTGIEYQLLQARDKRKDQTYFLCQLSQQQLKRALFPLGDLTKPEVRAMAKKAKLPTADKPESMGICFVGEVKMDDFLRLRIKERSGNIVSTAGEVLGRHKGLPFYTIGQRKGLSVPGILPWFVVAKELKSNHLVVAAGDKAPELYQKSLVLNHWHWVLLLPKKNAFRCKARIRHGQPLQSAIFYPAKNPKVVFSKPQRAVTPGQYCAIYLHGQLLGGGAIK